MPSACAPSHSLTSSSTESWKLPGMELIGLRTPSPGQANRGRTKCGRFELGFAHQPAHGFGDAQPSLAMDGEGHSLSIVSKLPVPPTGYRLSESSNRTPSVFCSAVRMVVRFAADGLPLGPSMRMRLLAGIRVRLSRF